MKLISWNVNGINSCFRKGLLKFIKKENADIYCFQEIKSSPQKIPEPLKNIKGYFSYMSFGTKNGYSGLIVYSKAKPISVIDKIGDKSIDKEARVLALEFRKFYLINAYFPHSSRGLKRISFKLRFNKKFSDFCKRLERKKPIVIASDFNVAHKEIDLKNPKQNEKNAGFTEQERSWFDRFLNNGHIDTFREFTKQGGHYTWWTWRNNARKRNIGWRIDYFVVSRKMRNKLVDSAILSKIYGSDHCPILLKIKV
jgi:exodeoxyribonuclease-3